MTVEPSSDDAMSALFGNLSWILPLVGVEQLIGFIVGFERHSWKVAAVAIGLGPVCFVLAGGIGWTRKRISGRWRLKREQAAALKAEEDARLAQEKAAFEAFPAELGIVDHGVNTVASIQALMDILRLATPHVGNIIQCLFKETPAKLHVGIDPAKKQLVLKGAAEHLRSDVLALEEMVPRANDHVATFTEAYRAVFKLPIETTSDREQLRSLKAIYGDGVANSFRQFANLAEERAKNIRRFQGNQQDLNRVVTRASAAIDKLVAATRGLASFCTGEMSQTIDRLLAATKSVDVAPVAVEGLRPYANGLANVKVVLWSNAHRSMAERIVSAFQLAGWDVNYNPTAQEMSNPHPCVGIEVRGFNAQLVDASATAVAALGGWDVRTNIDTLTIPRDNQKWSASQQTVYVTVGYPK